MKMKWSELKKLVDEKLERIGIPDPEISFIDVELETKDEDIWIEDGKLIINN